MPLAFDPDYEQALSRYAPLLEGIEPAPAGDIATRRRVFENFLRVVLEDHPMPENVAKTDFATRAPDGEQILLRWYTRQGSSKDSAVYFIHGGGMILNNMQLYDRIVAPYVSATGVPFLSVEYRKAPEYPHPIPVEDCYAGLIWLTEHAEKLGVDRDRIAVMGDSAGGGLAAAVAIMARDRHGPTLAAQILLYPMLDDRNTSINDGLLPFVSWNHSDNQTAWSALLGEDAGLPGVSPYAAPARLTDAKDLPRLYMELGELDIFREEDLAYASRLAQSNISTELHLHPGVPHAWELVAPDISVSVRSRADRHRFINSL